MNQLELDRGMSMPAVFLKRMGVNNGNPVDNVGVHKQSDACHVRNKQYRQKPLQYIFMQLFHRSSYATKVQKRQIPPNPYL